jgi:hypothetical protein
MVTRASRFAILAGDEWGRSAQSGPFSLDGAKRQLRLPDNRASIAITGGPITLALRAQ